MKPDSDLNSLSTGGYLALVIPAHRKASPGPHQDLLEGWRSLTFALSNFSTVVTSRGHFNVSQTESDDWKSMMSRSKSLNTSVTSFSGSWDGSRLRAMIFKESATAKGLPSSSVKHSSAPAPMEESFSQRRDG
ncbi:hypothetical protein FOCC_FOCC012414 [Frankliniella occidentalis]|nr:hypothetical protein FOCC_FOCC012414 [Frankliniella occidentalis]